MGWQDRNYNTGGGSGSDFLGNPAALLGFALPFGTWFGARVRLHFWLLLEFVLAFADYAFHGGGPLFGLIFCVLLLIALLLHEFGHRIFASWVGGSHNEFVLWPVGGIVPPVAPPFPWPYFVANLGGMVANLLFAFISILAATLITHSFHWNTLNPLALIMGDIAFNPVGVPGLTLAGSLLNLFAIINLGILFGNFLPYYWFDGGPLLEAILWPFFKRYNAINITCIVGMVLAVPMFFLSLMAGSAGLFAMILWALLFASAYSKRQQLKATGPQEMEEAIAWSAGYSGAGPTRRKKLSKYAIASARKKRDAEQLEQARIDAILEKVHTSGLHSLTFWEKRALKKATERQRQRDLANKR
jgi:hypothetical protein